MSRHRFYLLALGLPVFLPVLLLLLEQNTSLGKARLGDLLGGVLLVISFSIVIAGVQYLAFAIGVIFWLRRKSAGFIARVSWLLPILFLPVMFAGLMLVFGTSLNPDDWEKLPLLLGVTLLLGYFYVIAAHVLAVAFSKCRLIRD